MVELSGVLVVIETSAGDARDASLEALTAARELTGGGSLTALVVGSGIEAVAGAIQADRVLIADAPELERYTADGYSKAIEAAIESVNPKLVLLGGTTSGRDLGPYLSAKAGANCLSDCVALRWDDDTLVGTRPVYQGKLLSDVSYVPESTAFAVVRGGTFEAAEAGQPGSVESLPVEFSAGDLRVELTDVTIPPAGAVDLEGAETIVAGGRGLGSQENFLLVEQLAEALGGAVGATRAVTDLGWRPHYEQIGQTGKTVKPKLYFAVGISGAVQHLVGMQGAETVVAINRDPDAPIFKLAQIGVVGDLNELLPALISEIQAARG
ncbi:MAG: electron transfer flavoprotein subunit alpha/FixB family protein [Chloroflexia bacterium]|nr:electron transfer flavoprotein subunit alpha/FixB family protein [Chloroflexia bacterium]